MRLAGGSYGVERSTGSGGSGQSRGSAGERRKEGDGTDKRARAVSESGGRASACCWSAGGAADGWGPCGSVTGEGKRTTRVWRAGGAGRAGASWAGREGGRY